MGSNIRFNIADIIVGVRSESRIKALSPDGREQKINTFVYKGRRPSQILISVRIVSQLPELPDTKPLYLSSRSWMKGDVLRVSARGDKYYCRLHENLNEQVMVVNKDFDHATVYLWERNYWNDRFSPGDIVLHALYVLMMNYLGWHRQGLMVHGAGIKGVDGRGMIFSGKSGAGKSTSARLWHKYSKAEILNDDRIIVRNIKGRYIMYSTPWHGDFSDYLDHKIKPVPLDRFYFIYHAKENITHPLGEKSAFAHLYPAIFPTFWNKKCQENVLAMCHDLIRAVPSFTLGFVNDKKIVRFIEPSEKICK